MSFDGPARQSALNATDLVIKAMEEFSDRGITRVTMIAMNDDGSDRTLYSNARSEPEMFGMIHMAIESFTENLLEEE